MYTLPNGVVVFNGTPHEITFWDPEWDEPPVNVPSHGIINAKVENRVTCKSICISTGVTLTFLEPTYQPTPEGDCIVANAFHEGAHVIVGSVIAAQAYDVVVSMVPCEGYERVPPSEKRMRPDTFSYLRPKGE